MERMAAEAQAEETARGQEPRPRNGRGRPRLSQREEARGSKAIENTGEKNQCKGKEATRARRSTRRPGKDKGVKSG